MPTMQEYLEFTRTTVAYPASDSDDREIAYLGLGIGNEAGEVQGKIKKYLRGDYDIDNLEYLLMGELGDVLWYLTRLADVIGCSLEDIAVVNMAKLRQRQHNNTIKGDGDNR